MLGCSDLLLHVGYFGFELRFGCANAIPGNLQGTKVVNRKSKLHLVQTGTCLFVSNRALGLAFKRPQLTTDLGSDVANTGKMIVHLLEFTRAFLFALLVLQNARGFLDESAAIFRARLQDLIELALRDYGMRTCSKTRVVQDVKNVHATCDHAVDQVF